MTTRLTGAARPPVELDWLRAREACRHLVGQRDAILAQMRLIEAGPRTVDAAFKRAGYAERLRYTIRDLHASRALAESSAAALGRDPDVEKYFRAEKPRHRGPVKFGSPTAHSGTVRILTAAQDRRLAYIRSGAVLTRMIGGPGCR
jgi:hypothetical protein